MLIEPDGESGKRLGAEKVEIAAEISVLDVTDVRQRRGVAQRALLVEARGGETQRLARHAGLVRFQHFAGHAMELDAVAVVGNMAAGDHERGNAAPEGVMRERRRRNAAAKDGDAAGVADRLRAGAKNARRRGAQIARQSDLAAGGEFTELGEILQETQGVAVADAIRHGADQPARAAGSESDAAFLHQRAHGECRRVGHVLPLGYAAR